MGLMEPRLELAVPARFEGAEPRAAGPALLKLRPAAPDVRALAEGDPLAERPAAKRELLYLAATLRFA